MSCCICGLDSIIVRRKSGLPRRDCIIGDCIREDSCSGFWRSCSGVGGVFVCIG